MNETHLNIKGRNGFSIESLSWIFYIILFEGLETIPIWGMDNIMLVKDCTMKYYWNYLSQYGKLLLIWLF